MFKVRTFILIFVLQFHRYGFWITYLLLGKLKIASINTVPWKTKVGGVSVENTIYHFFCVENYLDSA